MYLRVRVQNRVIGQPSGRRSGRENREEPKRVATEA
jgi:hypothetical protein